jgi:cell division protein FtsW
VLAVVGEELGVAGIGVLLFLYGMIAWAGLRAAKAAKGAYAKLTAAGLTSLILCQASLNVFTVLGLAPLTGVPLPFISYGSSNLMVLLAAMGLLLNIAAGGTAASRSKRAPARPPALRAVAGGKGRAAAGRKRAAG